MPSPRAQSRFCAASRSHVNSFLSSQVVRLLVSEMKYLAHLRVEKSSEVKPEISSSVSSAAYR